MIAGVRNRTADSVRSRALQLVKDGYTVRQTAKKLAVSMASVRAWIDHRPEPRAKELPEGIRMLQAWPPRISE